jgi:hypothetical protein
MEAARGIVGEIAELLRRYGYDEMATYADRLTREADSAEFWDGVSGIEFWGGSGAVWEVPPFNLTHPQAERASHDYRRFRERMVELADTLGTKGLSSRAASTAELFRRQLSEEE